MEDIITYMIEEQWGDDLKGDRKRFLLKLAKRLKLRIKSPKLAFEKSNDKSTSAGHISAFM